MATQQAWNSRFHSYVKSKRFDLHSYVVKHLAEAFGFIKARLMDGFQVKKFFTSSSLRELFRSTREIIIYCRHKKILETSVQKLKVDKNVRNVLNTLTIYSDTDWSLAWNSKMELVWLGFIATWTFYKQVQLWFASIKINFPFKQQKAFKQVPFIKVLS